MLVDFDTLAKFVGKSADRSRPWRLSIGCQGAATSTSALGVERPRVFPMNPQQPAFLTRKELEELTGSPLLSVQARWLNKRGWRYELGEDGRPIVLRSIEQRIRSDGHILNTYDLNQAAAIAHVHPHTLRKMASLRQVPSTKIGRSWIFPAHLFDGWIEQKCLSTVATIPPSGGASYPSLAMRLENRLKQRIAQRQKSSPDLATDPEAPRSCEEYLVEPDSSGD